MHWIDLCDDSLTPLFDDELKLVSALFSNDNARITLAQVLDESTKTMQDRGFADMPVQAESGAIGAIVAQHAHLAALLPRLIATINVLRPDLHLVSQ